MGSSFSQVYVHIVFHVKNDKIKMRDVDLPRIFQYVGGIINNTEAIPIEIGGVGNHIHILSTLPRTMTISDFVKRIKSNSSKWIKTIDKHYESFAWQDGYGVFSVSHGVLNTTIKYIQNQKQHHKKRTFKSEYKTILDKHHIQYDEKFVFN